MSEVLRWSGWAGLTAAACAVGALLCAWFVLRYQTLTGGAWRSTAEGRFLMIRKALLGALFTAVLGEHLFPRWPVWGPVVFLLVAVYAAHTYVPYRLMLRAQREGRKPRRKRAG